jgi:hypothetical protein
LTIFVVFIKMIYALFNNLPESNEENHHEIFLSMANNTR